MPVKQKTLRRNFQMHNELLYSVILRQAGTLSKAILEGVMNSIDARATRCAITLDETTLVIEDNGQGFRSKAEIQKFFEVFGQPHEDNEQKIYGTFRMGRGQLFAFGVNHWRTGNYSMDVDIKGRGITYDLGSHETKHPGCRVEVQLYNPLGNFELLNITREIEKFVKWVAIPVTFNGERISQSPEEFAKWDYEDEDCYVQFRDKHTFQIYNLGVLVEEVGAHAYGYGGLAVSKNQLKVNFARNSVMSDCPIWTRIKKLIKQRSGEKLVTNTTLGPEGRASLIDRLISDDVLPDKVWSLKIIEDSSGRTWSPQQLYKLSYTRCYTDARPHGDVLADKMLQRQSAFVFSTRTLEHFNCPTSQGLVTRLASKFRNFPADWTYVPFKQLVAGINTNYTNLATKDYSEKEKIAVEVAAHCQHYITGSRTLRRQVIMGIGPANGWTDGKTYIAINREYLRELELNTIDGLTSLSLLILHELMHDNADLGTHVHTPEFYQKFHDEARLRLPTTINHAIAYYGQAVRRSKRRISKRDALLADRAASLGS